MVVTDTLHGRRAMVFDHMLFEDDVATPLSHTVRPATIVCHYGYRFQDRTYPDCVDVVFDHRPERISRSHFTNGIKLLD